MKLVEWLEATDMPRYQFARLVGVSPICVTDYCRDRAWPKRHTLEKIVKVTAGRVTANDFLSPRARALIDHAAG